MLTLRLPFLRPAVAMLALVALGACSKKSDTPTPTPSPTTTSSFTFTDDGTPVVATLTSASVNGNQFLILGGTANSSSFSLFTPNHTGTFTLPDPSGTTAAVYSVAGNTQYFAASGNITVSSYTASTTRGASNIVGTFSLVMGGSTTAGMPITRNITNGSFNVKF